MKFLTKTLAIAAVSVTAFTASAQFHGAGPNVRDLLNGVPLIVTAGAVSNITVFGIPTQNGYSIAPYFALTNSGTPSIQFQVSTVVPSITNGTVVGSAVMLGGVTASGTTAVRGLLLWT